MSIHRLYTVTAFVMTLPIMGCVGPMAPADPLESEETETSSQAIECVGQCTEEVIQCESDCLQFDPYWDEAYYRSCLSQCYMFYDQCLDMTYVYSGPSYQICHIDPDAHFSGVDVELHTVDVYVDSTCAGAFRYRKRVLDSVHCGFHSESTCKQRVLDRITGTWIAQGYYPTVTETDGETDKCPGPRL